MGRKLATFCGGVSPARRRESQTPGVGVGGGGGRSHGGLGRMAAWGGRRGRAGLVTIRDWNGSPIVEKPVDSRRES